MRPDFSICHGYLRQDGRKGIRNKLLVIYTVDCAAFVAEEIARFFKVRDLDVDWLGNRSCFDNTVMQRRILSYIAHPNVGAVLVVGHGCEYMQADALCNFAITQGKPADYLLQQTSGGTAKSITTGISKAWTLLHKLQAMEPIPFYWKDLTVGSQCGGSDFTSGLIGNHIVGNFFDYLIEAGGSCVFQEIAESIGLRDYMVNRGATEQAKHDIGAAYDKSESICKSCGQYSISPGNFDGGLTTIEEKSMGATIKSGSKPIQGVLKIGQQVPGPGLWQLDSMQDLNYSIGFTNVSDASDLMDTISTGTLLNLLVTGRGHVQGTPIAPTIKITGNPKTYEALPDDIDVNGGKLLLGVCTQEEIEKELLELVQAVCAGKKTKAELLGHQECEMTFNYQITAKTACYSL